MLLYHEMFIAVNKFTIVCSLLGKNILSFNTRHTSYDIHVSDIISWLWGDMNNLIKTFITFVLFAFLSTIMLNIYKHSMSRQLVLQETFKIIIVFMLVAISHIIDSQIIGNNNSFQTITALYYIAHKAIIVLENAVEMNIPVPEFLKKFLLKLRNKVDHHEF